MKKKLHVTKTDKGWQVKGQGAQRASVVKETKVEAVNRAAEIGRNSGNAQVIIHKTDGKIQSERTYGKDPFPPEGIIIQTST